MLPQPTRKDTRKVLQFLEKGEKRQAVKYLRDRLYLDKAEAKLIVDALAEEFDALGGQVAPIDLPIEVEELAIEGEKIKAMKLLREMTDLSLEEAKEAVEEFMAMLEPDEPEEAPDPEAGSDTAGKGCAVLVALGAGVAWAAAKVLA